jgi:hypothetical protein
MIYADKTQRAFTCHNCASDDKVVCDLMVLFLIVSADIQASGRNDRKASVCLLASTSTPNQQQ